MKINFKGGCFNFNFFKPNQTGLCPVSPWTKSSQSMDIVQSAWTLWTLSRVSMNNVQTVHWVHGQCPLSPWTMSTESMDIVQSGWSHWTLSMDSLAFFQSIHGHCPMSRLSTESMVNVHWVHGQCPGSPLSPWTFYRWVKLWISFFWYSSKNKCNGLGVKLTWCSLCITYFACNHFIHT